MRSGVAAGSLDRSRVRPGPRSARSSVTWSMDTPLRRDHERRQALVELDALAALMLGLTAEQLCAMYRTQFAVLRKYEYKMAFDAEGRKICGYHQSAGYRQSPAPGSGQGRRPALGVEEPLEALRAVRGRPDIGRLDGPLHPALRPSRP